MRFTNGLKWILIGLFFLAQPIRSLGQIKIPPDVKLDTLQNDSVIKVVFESEKVYDYYSQRFRPDLFVIGTLITIPLDTIITDSLLIYRQVIEIDKSSSIGTVKIYYKGRIIKRYFVENGEVSGQALVYDWNTQLPIINAMFERGKLNGVAAFYMEEIGLREIVKYEDGVFMEHLYHWRAYTKEGLEFVSQQEGDPANLEQTRS